MGGAGHRDRRLGPQLGRLRPRGRLPAGFAEWKRDLITDPQTSGGLLVACAPDAGGEVLAEFRREGFAEARKIGVMAPARRDWVFPEQRLQPLPHGVEDHRLRLSGGMDLVVLEQVRWPATPSSRKGT